MILLCVNTGCADKVMYTVVWQAGWEKGKTIPLCEKHFNYNKNYRPHLIDDIKLHECFTEVDFWKEFHE